MSEGPLLCNLRSLELSIVHSEALRKSRSVQNMENEDERPVRRIRRERLKQLIEEFGGPGRLAQETGTVDTHLTTIVKGRRDVGDELATKLERKTGKPFGWMDALQPQGLSPMALDLAVLFDEIANQDVRQKLFSNVEGAVISQKATAQKAETSSHPADSPSPSPQKTNKTRAD